MTGRPDRSSQITTAVGLVREALRAQPLRAGGMVPLQKAAAQALDGMTRGERAWLLAEVAWVARMMADRVEPGLREQLLVETEALARAVR